MDSNNRVQAILYADAIDRTFFTKERQTLAASDEAEKPS
jgi:hypothetical protein